MKTSELNERAKCVNDTPRDDCIFGNHLCLSAPLQLLREHATIFQNILVNCFITIRTYYIVHSKTKRVTIRNNVATMLQRGKGAWVAMA